MTNTNTRPAPTYCATDDVETWPVEREPGQTLDELARD